MALSLEVFCSFLPPAILWEGRLCPGKLPTLGSISRVPLLTGLLVGFKANRRRCRKWEGGRRKKVESFLPVPSWFVAMSLDVGTSLHDYSSLSAMPHPWLLLALGLTHVSFCPSAQGKETAAHCCQFLPASPCLVCFINPAHLSSVDLSLKSPHWTHLW